MSSETPATRRLVPVVAIGLAIVALATWFWLREQPEETGPAPRAGGDLTGCGPVLREPTGGAGAHVAGAVDYEAAPPSFGDHAPRWEVRARSFYAEDRPDVPVLVHNLEHGYNILWYDQTVSKDQEALAEVQEIADAYASLDSAPDPTKAFIAAPWTPEDGAAFPDGRHYALTHWYADPEDRTGSRADEVGLTKYCTDISAEVVAEWMSRHPLRDSPEGFPDLM